MDSASGWGREPGAPHRRPPVWVGDAVAVALVVVAAFVPFPQAEFRPSDPLVLAVVLAPAVLLPVRRRWPIPVLAAVLVLYGVAAAFGTLAPGIVVAAAVAMFAVADRRTRRTTAIVAAAATVAVALLSLFVAAGGVFDPRALQFAVMIAFAAAAGDANRSRREYITAMTERAERAEQTREAEASRRVTEERLRIARDLHDAVAHQISVISLNAGVASATLETRPERAREALVSIRRASRSVLSEIGDLLEMLRADESQRSGSRPQAGLDDLGGLVEEFAAVGLAVTVRIEGDTARVNGTTAFVGFRIVQEGLTNAHKHGSMNRAHVLIDVGDQEVAIVVTNPTDEAVGGAQPADAAPLRRGHGLLGIRERVTAVRGTLESGPGAGGWRLAATLPIGERTSS